MQLTVWQIVLDIHFFKFLTLLAHSLIQMYPLVGPKPGPQTDASQTGLVCCGRTQSVVTIFEEFKRFRTE